MRFQTPWVAVRKLVRGGAATALAVLLLVPPASSQSPEIKYVYDELGRLVAVIDQNGEAAKYTYDAVGNILSITRYGPTTVSVISFTPASGPVGTTVTINGTAFSSTPASNTVTFNGTAATVTSATANKLVVTVPTGATTGNIAVTSPNGTATSSTPYTVTAATSAPTITGFSPAIGLAGTAVTVSGTGFETVAANNNLKLNTHYAQITSATETSLGATVGPSTTGHFSVRTPKGSAASSGFFFVPPSPRTPSEVEFTGSLQIGGSYLTVPINTAGKIALVAFDGTAGQRITVTGSNGSLACGGACARLTLYSPLGAQMGQSCYDTTEFIDAVTLPITGTYQLLQQQQNCTGSIRLQANPITDVTGTITPGGAAVPVSITTPGQNARLTFTATAGQKVSLNLSAGGTFTSCGVDVTIQNSVNSVLASAPCITYDAYIDTTTLPTAGTYSVVIDPRSTNTGTITATLYDASEQTGTINTDGSATVVNLSSPGRNGRFTFSGTAGQRVSLSASNDTIASTTLSILRPPLTAAQKYDLKVEMQDGQYSGAASLYWSSASLSKEIVPSASLYPAGQSSPGGLKGEYFETTNFWRVPWMTRTDPTVNFYWGGSPGAGLPEDGYSVRWTGQVQPAFGEEYTFCLNADEPSRVWLDGNLIINKTTGGSTVETCVSSSLLGSVTVGTSGGLLEPVTLPVTGTYTVLVDPASTNTGSITIRLYNVPADSVGAITPGSPVASTVSIPGQNPTYTFSGTRGQNVSLVTSSVTVPNSVVSIVSPPLTANEKYDLKMEYYEDTQVARAGLFWSSPSIAKQVIPSTSLFPAGQQSPGGLQGDYFSNKTLTGTPALTRTDPVIDFYWGYGTPGSPLPNDLFSVRWTGQVQAQYSEPHTLCSWTDEGMRLWVNDFLFIDRWTYGSSESCATFPAAVKSASYGTSGTYIDRFTLPFTGTYKVVLDPQTTGTGNTTVTLYNIVDVTGSIAAGTAQPVALSTPGQTARLSFSGTANQRVNVSFAGGTFASCFTASLLRPDGTTLASACVGPASGLLGTQTLPATGTYTVVLDPQNAETGSVNVTLNDVVDVTGNVTIDGSGLNVSTAIPDQNARISFSGTAGQSVAVSLTNGTYPACSLNVYVLNPDGTILEWATCWGGTATKSFAARPLPASGTYTIVLDPQGTATGSQTVTVTTSTFNGNAATFLGKDLVTQGTWTGVYGADGYMIVANTTNYPSYAQVSATGNSSYTWWGSTSDVRALLKPPPATDRIGAAWYSNTQMTIDINLTDGNAHRVAFYLADYDTTTRAQTIEIVDAATSAVLDSRSASVFDQGQYYVWNLQGHVLVRMTRTGGWNAVTSGIFFDPPGSAVIASAAFVSTDTTTQGNWKPGYGTNGYVIVGDATSYPSYARMRPANNNYYAWSTSTSDVRALLKAASSTDRIMACWHNGTALSLFLNLTDNNAHRLALYLADYDTTARAQTMEVIDVNTGVVLDTRAASSFNAGMYYLWNLKGNVEIRLTRTAGNNAVVSGVFFDPSAP